MHYNWSQNSPFFLYDYTISLYAAIGCILYTHLKDISLLYDYFSMYSYSRIATIQTIRVSGEIVKKCLSSKRFVSKDMWNLFEADSAKLSRHSTLHREEELKFSQSQ